MKGTKEILDQSKFFKDIIGYDSVKNELFRLCDMVLNPDIYRRLNVRIPHGILIYGEQGCGKTSIASELASVCADNLYFIDGAQEDDTLHNEVLEKLKEANNQEEHYVVLIDNLDKFGTRDENATIYDTLFDLMQTFIDDDNDECFFIATAEKLKNLPHCLMRKNAFEHTIHIEIPVYKDIQRIVQHYAKLYPLASDVDFNDIEKLFYNEPCRYIVDAFDMAGRIVGYDRRNQITTEDFVKAHIFLQNHAVLGENPDEVSAWHEAGHLVVCELMSPGCVSIAYVADGEIASGVLSRWKPLQNNQLVISALAGKAACEIQFGKDAEGVASDLNRARDYLFDEIYQGASYGFLGLEATSGVRDSESTTFERETIVRAELQRYLFTAQTILAKNREFLEKIANALMEKSYLLNSDIAKIKKSCSIHPMNDV